MIDNSTTHKIQQLILCMYMFFREYINPPSITSLPSSQNLVVRLGKSGVAPIVELAKAIFKKRPDNQRNLIFLQVSLKLQVYWTAYVLFVVAID